VGIVAADERRDPLVIACIGDSNTELPTYTLELRTLLQSCYGERGVGYHAFGARANIPRAPVIKRTGAWNDHAIAPNVPAGPLFAVDGIWTSTSDTTADVGVAFTLGEWGNAADRLSRAYDGQHRVRLHYTTGPGLGSLDLIVNGVSRGRIDCSADAPGYAVSESFLADSFSIDSIKGEVILLGFDANRQSYRDGKPVLAGGAIVHALGRGWAQAAHFRNVEREAYTKFFAATKPDLIMVTLGTNDMHNQGVPEHFRDNLIAFVEKLKSSAPDTSILLISCPEAPQTKPGLAAKYRDVVAEVARDQGVASWSLTDVVGPHSREWIHQGLYADGLHYNRLGGALFARLLLRQLQFDLNDLKHYPILLVTPESPPPAVTFQIRMLKEISPESISELDPIRLWNQDVPAADVRLAITGDTLHVSADVYDRRCKGDPAGWPLGTVDSYVAPLGGEGVRQVVMRTSATDAGQVTVHENGRDVQGGNRVRVLHTPLDPFGYRLEATVPLDLVKLDSTTKQFKLEMSVLSDGGFVRAFARRADQGAFRDASQSAVVTIQAD